LDVTAFSVEPFLLALIHHLKADLDPWGILYHSHFEASYFQSDGGDASPDECIKTEGLEKWAGYSTAVPTVTTKHGLALSKGLLR